VTAKSKTSSTEFKSPYTEDEFQRQLKERGVTVEDLKNTVRRELSIQKLINREVVSKVAIVDQDIADFYNATARNSMLPNRNSVSRRSSSPRARIRKSAIARTTTPPTKPKRSAK